MHEQAAFPAVLRRARPARWRRDAASTRRCRIAFFTVAVSLFPLGVGPEPQMLRQIAPGVVWVCALLAAMLSVTQLYAADHADGSLEQMLLVPGARIADRRRQGGRRTGS